MINLQNLKNLISKNPKHPTTDDFIEIHKGLEGYLRRSLFIGLRLNGVKYETSVDVIKMSYLNNRDLLKKTIELITQGTKTLVDFENHNPDLKELENLLFDFTSIYRNRVVHGVYDRINDQTELRYCYYIDKFFIEEFESTLISLGFKSAFNKPKDWGAKRTISSELFNQVIKRLSLGKITKAPRGIIFVQNSIALTKYNGKV